MKRVLILLALVLTVSAGMAAVASAGMGESAGIRPTGLQRSR